MASFITVKSLYENLVKTVCKLIFDMIFHNEEIRFDFVDIGMFFMWSPKCSNRLSISKFNRS
jgi:hypothetical protein